MTDFDNEWDNMPEGRQKFVHGVGAVCKFTLDIHDSPYTGLFKNGVQTGIIRIGPALDMNEEQLTEIFCNNCKKMFNH